MPFCVLICFVGQLQWVNENNRPRGRFFPRMYQPFFSYEEILGNLRTGNLMGKVPSREYVVSLVGGFNPFEKY